MGVLQAAPCLQACQGDVTQMFRTILPLNDISGRRVRMQKAGQSPHPERRPY